MSERRYTDDEVARIFARATETTPETPRALPPGDGMTLAELQEIGREVGIDPGQVADAARWVDRPAPAPRQPERLLGFPIGVSHAVQLPYRMSDQQWERLVIDLRETFDAAGRVRSDGAFRQWRNGNLQVLVEPGEEGDRVRFRTKKGSAQSLMSAGAAMFAVALFLVVATLLGFQDSQAREVLMVALMGGGMVGVGAAMVPTWARLRKSQMETIGARLLRP